MSVGETGPLAGQPVDRGRGDPGSGIDHDVLWIGAACGSEVCMADALRVSLRYGNLETLQEGYGLNLTPLVPLTLDHYQGEYAPTFQVKAKQAHLHEKDLDLLSRMQKAITVIQMNWMKMLDYYHEELISYADDKFDFPFEKCSFTYVPTKKNQAAALNFHLTAKEKIDLYDALGSVSNQRSFSRFKQIR